MDQEQVSHNDSETLAIDLRGQSCPFPLISALKQLGALETNGFGSAKFLDILVDCPPSIENIPLETGKRGYRSEVVKMETNEWRIRIFLADRKEKSGGP